MVETTAHLAEGPASGWDRVRGYCEGATALDASVCAGDGTALTLGRVASPWPSPWLHEAASAVGALVARTEPRRPRGDHQGR